MKKISSWSLVVKKILYLSVFLIVFNQVFIQNAFDGSEEKYKFMKVPTNIYPGGDSRNIQKAAFCYSYGHDYYSENECYKNNSLITNFYSDAEITPAYNYPRVVADTYRIFANSSEEFFQKFWIFNSIFFLITVLIYSYRINYLLFPAIIFSPVSLLLIERGNIDAIAFSILFLSLILTSSIFLRVIFIGIASSIKLFPIVSFLTMYKKKNYDTKQFFMGLLLVLPLIFYAFLQIQYIISSTSYGFGASFGLFSLYNAPFFEDNLLLTYGLLALYLILSSSLIFLISKTPEFLDPLMSNIKKLNKLKLDILIISSIIYISIFLLLTSWAYRLIFIIPIFLILSNFRDFISKITFGLILLIFWIPVLPYGWVYFNLLNYALLPLIILIFMHSYKYYYFK